MPLSLRKRGPYWYARGTVPARKEDGSIGRVRIEESTRTQSKTRAREIASDIERHYHDLAYGRSIKCGPSFAQAALTYIQTRGKSDRFVTKLIKFFGETPIADIDQAAVANAAHTLYPNAKASTHVRAVFAPTTTILRLSGVRPDFKTPKIETVLPEIPPQSWFEAVLPVAPARLAALIITLTLTSRRITELLSIRPEDVVNGEAVIGHTKTGKPIKVRIPDMALELLENAKPGRHRRSKSLFGYSNKDNARRALLNACEKAGVLVRDEKGKIVGGWYGTHAIGRHSFATRLLREGKSLKFVADAGGWASIKMPAQHYAHLEKSEVAREVEKVGQEWGKKLDIRRKNCGN